MLTRHKEGGATLIEVLVTMVVLAIGLLGLAGLQITSVQSNHSAYYRSQATLLAYDLADRMRSNRTEALDNGYIVDFPSSSTENSVSGSQSEKDKAEWLNKLADTLPSGTGKVERTGELFTIHVRWDDSRGEIKATDDTEIPNQTFLYRTEI